MRVGAPHVPSWIEYLADHGQEQERIGLCASLFSHSACLLFLFIQIPPDERVDTVTALGHHVAPKDMHLVFAPNDVDLVDLIWKDQPQPSAHPIFQHPLQLAGKPASEKIEALRNTIKKLDTQAYLASELAEVAWL